MSGMTKWGFRATLKLHTSSEDESAKVGPTNTLYDIVHNKLSTVDTTHKLWLNPLLFNGLLQTLYYAQHNSADKFQVYYGREIFEYKDGGVASLDWIIPKPESKDQFKKLYEETLPEGYPRLHPRTRFFTSKELEERRRVDQSESTAPICVVLHGLAGGSHEPLIRNFGEDMKKSDNKWDVVVINSRGCCRTKITSDKLFNAFSTDDIKDVLLELRKRYPKRPLYGIGFSFGACLWANLLGSQDSEVNELVKTCVLIGCPWDLADSAYHLEESYTGKYLLNPSLTLFLTKLLKSNKKELQAHNPEFFSDKRIAEAAQLKKTFLWDNAFTCRTIGYRTSFQYYREGSPLNRIHKISTPTLIINSTDDPAVSCRLPFEDVKANPYLAMVESDLGGHLGFVKSSGEFWCVEAAKEFLDVTYNAQK